MSKVPCEQMAAFSRDTRRMWYTAHSAVKRWNERELTQLATYLDEAREARTERK